MTTQKQNPAYAINGQPASAEAFYAIACDPRRSVAVEACAGAGKTWMLIERMVKALEQGAEAQTGVRPDEILAITFTKKAAGEMRDRLQKRLADPAMKPLRSQILASGRSVQISTFHAWFAQLLRAAPLSVLRELALPLTYELLEDDSVLLPDLRHAFYAAALVDIGLRDDFAALIEELGRSKVDDALSGLLAKRVEFELTDQQGLLEASVMDANEKQPSRELHALAAKVLGGYKTDELKAAANGIEAGLSNADVNLQFELLMGALLTKNASPKKYKSKISDQDRSFITSAQDDLLEILAARHQHTCWLYQQRMSRVGRAWLACFADHKRSRGLVDMADLERAATKLLSDPELSGAVQERLDQRLRHVMIDEFQDTNPLQWQAIHAWLGSYAGSGGGQNRPSLFIVGDPKQSIYRFRRAEPRVFAAAQAFMQETFEAALLSCDHTRRNAAGVLDVVNAAMMNAQEGNEYKGFRPHTTQSDVAGSALALPMIARVKKDKDAPLVIEASWRDSLTTPREDAEESLKAREADQAARWIAANGEGQSVMVLSRTHEPLGLIQQALQRYGVQASKLEKNDLADIPAVQDVLALLQFLVSPHSDLDLARALKSPLFAWTDEQLMQLRKAQLAALPVKKSWFELLDRQIKEQLTRWQAWMQNLPPHDALQAIYDDGDVLNKYLAAMPSAIRLSSHTALQALLSAALQVGGGRFLNAYAFVRAMRAKVQSIKAPAVVDQQSNVQLLTVHGAKGLEADVVVLLASDPEPRKLQSMTTLIDWQPEDAAPTKFVFLLSESNPPACTKALLEADFRAREVEEINTLYVATTRARRKLVVSASEAWNANPKSVWHRLQALCTPVVADAETNFTLGDAAVTSVRIEPVEMLPRTLLTLPTTTAVAQADDSNLAAQKGKALHRLLQWQSAGSAELAAVALEFSLVSEDAQSVGRSADLMLTGEAAWIWDAAKIDWQANEYELVHEGQVLRIDRLVKARATQMWWIIDFKSAANPEKSAALQTQLKTYRAAVSAQMGIPKSQIWAAFVTGDGNLIAALSSEPIGT
jgi:ATP-dependent helicase/nuclease subunit A